MINKQNYWHNLHQLDLHHLHHSHLHLLHLQHLHRLQHHHLQVMPTSHLTLKRLDTFELLSVEGRVDLTLPLTKIC